MLLIFIVFFVKNCQTLHGSELKKKIFCFCDYIELTMEWFNFEFIHLSISYNLVIKIYSNNSFYHFKISIFRFMSNNSYKLVFVKEFFDDYPKFFGGFNFDFPNFCLLLSYRGVEYNIKVFCFDFNYFYVQVLRCAGFPYLVELRS